MLQYSQKVGLELCKVAVKVQCVWECMMTQRMALRLCIQNLLLIIAYQVIDDILSHTDIFTQAARHRLPSETAQRISKRISVKYFLVYSTLRTVLL